MTRDQKGEAERPDVGRAPRAIDLGGSAAAEPRAPRAFDLADDRTPSGGTATIVETPLPPEEPAVDAVPDAPSPARLLTLSTVFWSALSLLLTLVVADWAWSLVLSLEAKAPWVGQAALGLVGIVAAGLTVFLIREARAILRLRKVAVLRERARTLAATPDEAGVRALARDLVAFYARDAASAAGRAEMARVFDELHRPVDLMAIAERVLLAPKDAEARKVIAAAAQRVSVVTALSPRAIVDVAFVLFQGVTLIRRLSTIYGGRASGFGLLRLTARVLAHLTLTGGMAVADSVLGQVVGVGLAARLSAKFGEGILNGVLTARVGIAALDLCRPFPFLENSPILLSEVVKLSVIQD